ncbi:MAG: hypothetical protein RLZZ416_588 [Candidatus Parcubacteria bacterium]|jgi:hypothetical protein
MKRLRELAARAATEIRRNPDKPRNNLRALADYFNHMVTGVIGDKQRQFDLEYWDKIAKAMEETVDPSELELWVAGVAGEISLLMMAHQQQIPRDQLKRNVLRFCDAIDIVG